VQGRTKAKTRYLKRKKSRRKARKSAAPKQPSNAVRLHEETDDEDSNDTQSEDDVPQELPQGVNLSKDLKEKQEGGREERPKKKQKLSLSEDEGNHMDVEEVPVAIGSEVDVPPPAAHIQPKSSEPQISLPVFSLPAPPDAPPKSVLALQGLDQALVEAEVVNPSSRLPITSDGDDGLSERTRRRLLELGITELFAG
jgi:ATP-dependent RNA helicase DDX51/DBP6